MFVMRVDMANDAFRESDDELPRLLRSVADQIGYGHSNGILHDYNGNRCGEWTMYGTGPVPEPPRRCGCGAWGDHDESHEEIPD